MFRLTTVKISKFNIIILIIARDLIVTIYLSELMSHLSFRWDLVLKNSARLNIV